MADESDEHLPVPSGHFEADEWNKRFNRVQRSLNAFPPEIAEAFYAMREKIIMLERDARDFVPRAEIEHIADKRADARLRALGFDVDHPLETSAQVQWLMTLKRSARGFLAAVGIAFLGLVSTLLGTFITSHWSK